METRDPRAAEGVPEPAAAKKDEKDFDGVTNIDVQTENPVRPMSEKGD